MIVFCSYALNLKIDENKRFLFLVSVMTHKQAEASGDLLQYITALTIHRETGC